MLNILVYTGAQTLDGADPRFASLTVLQGFSESLHHALSVKGRALCVKYVLTSFGGFDSTITWLHTAIQTKGGPFEKNALQIMSCEGRRTKAYDNDLRWRMVYQVKVQNLRHREFARNLCVDQSTVSRTVALFDDTGDVKIRKYPSNPGTVNLTMIN